MNRAPEALKGLQNLIARNYGPKRPLRIILDPGHGGTDPGAVGGGTTEALQVAEFAATLKFFLTQIPGVQVVISRGAAYPTWLQRTFNLGAADLAVSLHLDTANGTGRSMAYYAAGRDYARGPNPARSAAFARCLLDATPDPEFVVLPDTASRFGRLYIRGFLAPVAVLWEIDPVHQLNRDERIERAAQFIDALALALRAGIIA